MANDLFNLPKQIAKKLKSCAEEQRNGKPAVKYLWINVCEDVEGVSSSVDDGRLTQEQWMNVIDEAASLGVERLIVCVGDSPGDHTDVWALCKWAQEAHDIVVGLHVYDAKLDEETIAELEQLAPEKTCLVINKNQMDAVEPLREKGVSICQAEVPHEHRGPACTMPEEMVFVGPGGTLYTCGVVFGDQEYCMGNVLDRPLSAIMRDESLPHEVKGHSQGRPRNCSGCPPLLDFPAPKD